MWHAYLWWNENTEVAHGPVLRYKSHRVGASNTPPTNKHAPTQEVDTDTTGRRQQRKSDCSHCYE
jgi:hypothetical protein